MKRLLSRLRPTDREMYALAMRETDPRRYEQFAPIVRGPVFAILAAAGLGLLALLWAPFRLLRRPR
jgi:hypothetical protein